MMSLFRDEKDKVSMSRVLLLCNTLYIFMLGWVSVFWKLPVDGALWSLLGGMEIAFTAWAGGRAALQYLGPQVGAVAAGITGASRRFGTRSAYYEEHEEK